MATRLVHSRALIEREIVVLFPAVHDVLLVVNPAPIFLFVVGLLIEKSLAISFRFFSRAVRVCRVAVLSCRSQLLLVVRIYQKREMCSRSSRAADEDDVFAAEHDV